MLERSVGFTSRAVRRRVTAGVWALCPGCAEAITFRARFRDLQVICNVYEDGTWRRVEHWHDACYAAAEPYGPATA